MKPKNNATKSSKLVLILLGALLLSLASCQTLPDAPPPEPSPAHIDLSWPEFPDPMGIVGYEEDTQVITMPLSYWEAIARYVIAMEANRKIVEGAGNGK